MSRQLKYDKTALENAVRAVKSKSMGYLKASRLYNVPRSTIFDKVKGHSSIECTMGPHTILKAAEEKRIVEWLTQMSRIGYGRTKYELIRTVGKIVKEDGRKTPFKDGVPGKDWYYAFMARHPEIKLRSPRQLGKERAVITPERVEGWFHDFREYINEVVEDKNILLDPTRMYNVDESGFSLAVKTGHVLGVRGAKSVYSVSASDKSQITVLAGMSAAAHFLRPMIVFPGQRFTRNMLEGFDEAVLGRSSNGWMESELFASWLETVFIPDIEERQVRKPLILLVDGHSTHLTLEACDICRDNDIILYCLLEHASHLMQPCDLRFFCSLKESWKTAMRDWQIDHVGEYVTKFEFAKIFKHAWYASTKVENAVNSFRDAGLFPLDSSVVLNTDKFQTCVLFQNRKIEERKNKEIEETETQPENCSDESSRAIPELIAADAVQNKTPEDREPSEMNVSQESAAVGLTSQSEESQNRPVEQLRTGENDPCTTKANAESPMSKYLKIPTIKPSENKKSKKVLLPKAVTSDKFREYLLEKKMRKELEEKSKLLRKEEREKKKKEKEEAKKIREEEKLRKKKEKEENKAAAAKLKRGKSKKRKYDSLSSDEDSDSDINMSKLVQEDDSDGFEKEFEMCPACNRGDQHPSRWIKCESCQTRWHYMCANRPEYGLLDKTERAKMEFVCPMCD